MAKQNLTINQWTGGLINYEKLAQKNSFRFAKNLDPNQDPSFIIPSVKTTKVSGSTVSGLIKWMADGTPWDTNRYFYGEQTIYRETSAGVWSNLLTASPLVSSAGRTAVPNGQGLVTFNNGLYYATDITIGRYGNLDSSPVHHADLFGSVLNNNIDNQSIASGFTYTLPAAISEADLDTLYFVANTEPIMEVDVYPNAIGAGDWTLTLHDGFNRVIGSVTIANANLTALKIKFIFLAETRMIIGNTYHFHLTSTAGGSTVVTGTVSDFSTVEYDEYFQVLVRDADYHPMLVFPIAGAVGMVIGNGHYLATWDEATYIPNAISFEPGFKVRTLAIQNEFVVAGCWRGDTIDGVEEGRLYYWDGFSPNWNFFKAIPIGLPNAVTNYKNNLIGVYGSNLDLYSTSQYSNDTFHQEITIPTLTKGKMAEVMPGAMSNWQGLTMIGVSGNTDDAAGLQQGVYSYGTINEDLPDALNYTHTISTGTTTGTSSKVSMVKGVGKDLYIAWRDGSTYGVDKVRKSDLPAVSGVFESLMFDNGNPRKPKHAHRIEITFAPLVSGETITPKVKFDRATSFATGTTVSTVGSTIASYSLEKRFNEIEFGFNCSTATTFGPKVTSVTLYFDDLEPGQDGGGEESY